MPSSHRKAARAAVRIALAVLSLALLAAASAHAAEKDQSNTQEGGLDNAPEWALPRIEPAAAPSAEARAGTSYALIDRQIDWRGKESAYFNRFVIRVTNNESLKTAGEITLGFDPRSEERRVGKECRSRW